MTERILLERDEPLDLDATLGCGQAFRWLKLSGWWEGVVGGRAIRLRLEGRMLECRGADREFVRQYLALDHDLEAILSSIDRDAVVHAAIEVSYGLRILRQPLFECLISYLCATNTNIPAVRHRVAELSARFGERAACSDPGAYAFPSPAALAAATDEDFRACRLGYRSGFAERVVAALREDPSWEDHLRPLSYEEARVALTALPGIGPKAADCIALFGLGHLEAFPVDLWIRRIMSRHYFDGSEQKALTPAEYERVRRMGISHFGPFAGYAQEYLYAARRSLSPD